MKIVITDSNYLQFNFVDVTNFFSKSLLNYENKEIVVLKNENNKPILFSNKKYKILKSKDDKTSILEKRVLDYNDIINLYDIEENKYLTLYVLKNRIDLFDTFEILDDKIIIAGTYYLDADITLNDVNFTYFQLEIIKENNYYIMNKNDKDVEVYKNNKYMDDGVIKYGDYIFVAGIIFSLIDNKISIYYGNGKYNYSASNLRKIEIQEPIFDLIDTADKNNNFFIINKIFFKRIPKIQRKIETKTFNIDGPGAQELKESMPVILTMMPMMLMSTTSMISLINVINNITIGEKTVEESLGSIIVTGCMILAMVMYPVISNAYKKHRESKREIKRISEYKDYIFEKKRKILEEMNFQKNILCDNFKNTSQCKEIIELLNKNLWERKRGTEDFLTLSLGIGKIKPDIELKIPEEHFTIDKDKLRVQLEKLEEDTKYLVDVPITFDFYENNVVSFIGNKDLIHKYFNSLLIRLFAVCTYDDVKLVVLSDNKNKFFWQQYINLPYFWNDERNFRFFGYDSNSYGKIINYLTEEYNDRVSLYENEKDNNANNDYVNYIIFVDDLIKIKKNPLFSEIIKGNNLGFTIIFNTTKMDLLPSDCSNFIYINKNEGKLIINKNKNYIEEVFIPDMLDEDFTMCYYNLSNLYLDSFEQKFVLPQKYSFLEMYNAGNINYLNINDKWSNSSIIDSISVPIGIDDSGELVCLDLHENAHGPHGLVAGMTGSGKSELLITYILSLAINYSPEEVQFVLIDYKGGGLANTFYNSSIGMILPHVVGVITNINENEINRSLISLKSEVKRRQKVFAEVSIKYNEGNMDIYKYEAIYNVNKDIERLSHLFIISDEFAELKTQNPEFINELISIARIGRSLGIHLILSTQKPSGIVDDQIWSNSRFKICLKVQDKSDSNDMIKVPDAAFLKEAGRFYLQVGFNEMFIKGQSAYSGSEYIETNEDENNVDNEIDFINDNGLSYLTVGLNEKKNYESNGKQITNIVKYIIQCSKDKNYNIKGLWRELIPEKIYYKDLLEKYKYIKYQNVEAIVGEYDAPNLQKKGLATIQLNGKGNIILYGIIGSGKELFLQTFLYSLIDNYNSNEINIYIMDFGAETLGVFRNAPQVGDVIYINDKEKIINSFKYFNNIIEERKKLLINYNGDINNYNKENENKLPLITVVINVVELLFDNYDNLDEIFLRLTRESNRYGMTFLIASNGINNLRNKTIQGFKQIVSLELKEKYDYTNLFGNKIQNMPMKYKGRGYINMGDVFEFQTSYIAKDDDIFQYISAKCDELNRNMNKISAIPVLPNVVDYQYIYRYLDNNSRLPIGVNFDDLAINKFEMVSKRGIILSGLDMDSIINFVNSLEKNILSFEKNKLYVFNSYKKYNKINDVSVLISSDYKRYITQLSEYAKNVNNKSLNYILFVGISDIYNSFEMLEKKEFNKILKELIENDNFSVIIIDSSNNIKKLEFEEFYRNSINNTRGIWVGNGINEQMLIRYSKLPREYREPVTDEYGFVIENGIVTKIKLINYINN